jgi:hypothetical protein
MKPDMRQIALRSPIVWLWSSAGIPEAVDCQTLTRYVTEGAAEMIVCQNCYQAFLVETPRKNSGGYGDPPFHNLPDSRDPCIGNTMIALDIVDVPGLIDEDHWHAIEQDFLSRFWVEQEEADNGQ